MQVNKFIAYNFLKEVDLLIGVGDHAASASSPGAELGPWPRRDCELLTINLTIELLTCFVFTISTLRYHECLCR